MNELLTNNIEVILVISDTLQLSFSTKDCHYSCNNRAWYIENLERSNWIEFKPNQIESISIHDDSILIITLQ